MCKQNPISLHRAKLASLKIHHVDDTPGLEIRQLLANLIEPGRCMLACVDKRHGQLAQLWLALLGESALHQGPVECLPVPAARGVLGDEVQSDFLENTRTDAIEDWSDPFLLVLEWGVNPCQAEGAEPGTGRDVEVTI